MIEACDYDGITADTARALQHRLAQAQREGRVPSAVAAIARRGEPLWFGGAGTVGAAVPAPDVQYRIGSITKTMVAVLVLRLVEAGVVELDDVVGAHLHDSPAPDATVRQLLTHTAGISSETPEPWWERTDGSHRPALGDLLAPDQGRHRPGSTHHYSNPGFGILGELVTRANGRPWFDTLRTDVLLPLGMRRTSYLPDEPHARGWAVHPWADVLLPEPAHDHGLLAAAGQLWSTPADLCRFGVWLGGDGAGILSESTIATMRAPAVAPDDPRWTSSYGLGVQQLRWAEDDAVLFGHTGSMPGFLAVCLTSAERGLTVAVQSNAWSDFAPAGLGHDLLRIVHDREPTMPLPWTPSTPSAEAWELAGPWYWGAVPVTIRVHAGGEFELGPLGARGRSGRFVPTGDGRWVGQAGSYYHGEFLRTVRDDAGALTHVELASFVLTRRPYAPAEVVPDGLGLGDWQL